MARYNWLAVQKGDIVEFSLVNEKFDAYAYPKIRQLDDLLEKKLTEHGITCYKPNGADYYNLIPDNKDDISITAPLYELKDGSYTKIAEYFKSKTLDPEIYIQTYITAKRCKIEITEEQEKIFNELYQKNSLDSGLSSCITIGANDFNENYIPKGFIVLAEKFNSPNKKQVVIMKKQNFHGGRVEITVPADMRKLVVGPNGGNIKKIAKKLKIFYIHVK